MKHVQIFCNNDGIVQIADILIFIKIYGYLKAAVLSAYDISF